MLVRPIGSVVLLMIAANLEAAPLGTSFTYQGQLKENGQPANGLFDLQFCLFDAATGPIPLACATDADNVPVEGGLFAVTLDFGATPFNGEARHLELRVRPGASSGGYTILDPRQVIRPTPEALRATAASAAPWSGLSGVPTGFLDGVDADSGGTMSSFVLGAGLIDGDGNATITQGNTLFIPPDGISRAMIAPQAIGAGQVDTAEVQAAITSIPCPTGAFMVGVSGSSISCGSSGIVSSVTGGGGVTATPTTGGVVLGTDSTVQRRSGVPPGTTCPGGEAMTALAQSGTPTCSRFSRYVTASGSVTQPTAGGGAIGASATVASLGRTLLVTASVEMGSTMPGGATDLALSICGTGILTGGAMAFLSTPGASGLTVAANQRSLFTYTVVLDGSLFSSVSVSICGASNLGANWNNNGNSRLVVVAL